MAGELETDPETDPDPPPSSVRPSAPTLQESSEPRVSPGRPVAVRTPPPPSPLDRAVPQLSTTTPTGYVGSRAADPIAPSSAQQRSGGARSLIGQTLGRYEILEELGHGGMATVYRALDPRLEREVALKVIHRHLRDNLEIAERFKHEAKAVAKLKHPSIVEIYDVPDTDEEERFLVAELVVGPSLRRYLQLLRKELGHEHRGLFPPELAAALVLQVLSALERAHEAGIIHRDVKPENILVALPRAREGAREGALDSTRSSDSARSDSGRSDPGRSDPGRSDPGRLDAGRSDSGRGAVRAKLTDFGIAKILDAQSMTSTGQILGSPAHMAPEQIEAGDITPKVDIFATGVLFYELLTDALPFDGKNPAQVIRRVLEGEFTPADRAVPEVGGRWSGIVAQMLAREPERRPKDVASLEALIHAELAAMGVSDPDRELSDFFRDPRAVAQGWGARVKPRLYERAMAARGRGDVVGSAHDLNRALAYDPTDPKLVRAVTTLRSRERRLRGLRRGVPVVLAALMVSAGTFTVVRLSRRPASVPPTAQSSSAAPAATKSAPVASAVAAPTSAAPASAPVPPVIGKPEVGVASNAPPLLTTPPPTTADASVGKGVARRVRINVAFALSYSIDGGASHDAFSEPTQELSVGEHALSVLGRANCCVPFTRRFRVDPGEGELLITDKLTFKPARITVIGAVGAKLTVRRATDDVVVAAGPSPLDVPMTDTQLAVKVTGEATDFPPKTETYNLAPGDARSFRFEK
jgi:serine/threonine protein kinase